LFDAVPSQTPQRAPLSFDGLQQKASGIFRGESDALRLPGIDRDRIEPEWLPAIVEPVEMPEVMTVQVQDGCRWSGVAAANVAGVSQSFGSPPMGRSTRSAPFKSSREGRPFDGSAAGGESIA